jgi:hypothetical protein
MFSGCAGVVADLGKPFFKIQVCEGLGMCIEKFDLPLLATFTPIDILCLGPWLFLAIVVCGL